MGQISAIRRAHSYDFGRKQFGLLAPGNAQQELFMLRTLSFRRLCYLKPYTLSHGELPAFRSLERRIRTLGDIHVCPPSNSFAGWANLAERRCWPTHLCRCSVIYSIEPGAPGHIVRAKSMEICATTIEPLADSAGVATTTQGNCKHGA